MNAQSDSLASELSSLMKNYEPFSVDPVPSADVVFALNVLADSGNPAALGDESLFSEETRQVDGIQTIVCGRAAAGEPVFDFRLKASDGSECSAGFLVCAQDFHSAELHLGQAQRHYAIDNALMILYALATANLDTVLFHGAVVSKDGSGYMFLGKSGTGKSTHARLWLQNIPGTELVNDDNPVVRLNSEGGRICATIYGSPWSGKTPCYKNLEMPLGAVVQLSQAPYNRIRRLGGLQAYAVLVPSISGKRWDPKIADGLHRTENALAMNVPAYHLECLPDSAAAELCCSTISAACGSKATTKSGETCR